MPGTILVQKYMWAQEDSLCVILLLRSPSFYTKFKSFRTEVFGFSLELFLLLEFIIIVYNIISLP